MGFSEGNGHPVSFSAIVNGFDDAALAATGWPEIRTYLRRRPPSDFGFDEVRVTHLWTPDSCQAEQFAKACHISSVVTDPNEMIGVVDAVMILRDDPESHLRLARPFIDAGVPVFVDKPLCLSRAELDQFTPALLRGQLMSTSGLRFAVELDDLRTNRARYGEIPLVRASVVLDWTRYGIHMLEAAMGALGAQPVTIQRHSAKHESFALRLDNGTLLQIDALGAVPNNFVLDVFGTRRLRRFQITDNFAAFRRTIGHFVGLVRSRHIAVDPEETITVIRTLIAGLECQPGGSEVVIN